MLENEHDKIEEDEKRLFIGKLIEKPQTFAIRRG